MKIDGSYGEGGGQILRTAIALSALLGENVEIVNIRAKRKNPGLRNQHLWGIKLVAMMSNGRVEGLHLGSTRVSFSPGRIKGGEYKINVGTAGSISLVLQTALLPALFADEKVIFKLQGGTDVPWSPPIDYYAHVLLPILRRSGADVKIDILERGYYPKGGGLVRVIVQPNKLKKIEFIERGKLREKRAYLSLRNLPQHIVDRISNMLGNYRIYRDVKNSGISRGCSVVLASYFENTVLGADSLCRRGLLTEKVAEIAIKKISDEINSEATVDINMGDHLIPYGFAVGRIKYRVREVTMHTLTNAWVVENFGGHVNIKDNGWIDVQA